MAQKRSLQLFEPTPDTLYTLETVAHFGHVSKRQIAIYYKHGLLSPISDPAKNGYMFDAEALRTLRQIEYLRSMCGDDLVGISMILKLAQEVEQLRRHLEAVRSQGGKKSSSQKKTTTRKSPRLKKRK